jgi:cold shock CspA family protein
LATGRVLQFDQSRGFGFVAAEDGGEDIFLHVSEFNGYPDMLIPGALVEFQVMPGERGRKACEARLGDEEWEKEAPARAAGEAAPAAEVPLAAGEDLTCDLLSSREFSRELTRLLLTAVPELTGHQVVQASQGILELAVQHGWAGSDR